MLKVKNELHSSGIYKKLDTNPNTDPNYNYSIIIDEISQAKNKYMTKIFVMKFNKYMHKKSTWITQGLLTSIRYRDKLYKQYKITNHASIFRIWHILGQFKNVQWHFEKKYLQSKTIIL